MRAVILLETAALHSFTLEKVTARNPCSYEKWTHQKKTNCICFVWYY